MSWFVDIYNTLLYQPILNLLVGLYQFSPIQNFGIAIILITLITRAILHPINQKTIDSQKKMAALKPELDALQKKYKDDKEKLYSEMMTLYGKHKINPASGCLPILIQLPFFWAIYHAMREGLNPEHIAEVNAFLYPFIPQLTEINTQFLWFDLTRGDPLFILPVMVAGVQYLQSRVMLSMNNSSAMGAMGQQMMLLMPVFFLIISITLPSGLVFYIMLTSLFGIVQQVGYRKFFTFEWVKLLSGPIVQPAVAGPGQEGGAVIGEIESDASRPGGKADKQVKPKRRRKPGAKLKKTAE